MQAGISTRVFVSMRAAPLTYRRALANTLTSRSLSGEVFPGSHECSLLRWVGGGGGVDQVGYTQTQKPQAGGPPPAVFDNFASPKQDPDRFPGAPSQVPPPSGSVIPSPFVEISTTEGPPGPKAGGSGGSLAGLPVRTSSSGGRPATDTGTTVGPAVRPTGAPDGPSGSTPFPTAPQDPEAKTTTLSEPLLGSRKGGSQ